jgi:hypothetical protein
MKRILCLFVFLFHVCILVYAQAPTTPSSGVSFLSIDGDRFTMSWTSGNGARRIIILRQGSAVTAVPVNGVDYNSDAAFGNGDAIQPGQFVVYDNFGSSTVISNLSPNTTYHAAIFEYNGAASTTQYLTASFAIGNQATVSAPATPASAMSFNTVTGNSMNVSWVSGNGQRRLLLAHAGSAVNANPVDLSTYNANGSFGSGTQLGTGNYAVYGSTGNTAPVSGLQPSTTYHYGLYEYNGSQGPVYLIPGTTGSMTTAPRPTIAASALGFLSIDGDRMTLLWTNGNGARRIIVARAGSPVTAVPVDGVDYNADAVFGNGDAIQPGQFVMYDNTSTSVALSGMSPNTTYHFRIYEYDGSGATTAYLTSSFTTGSQATSSTPTIQVSNIIASNISGSSVTLSWTNGNGTARLVLARQGAAVNFVPVDATFYNVNAAFGTGTQLGTGNYSLCSSTGNTVNITNLLPNTTYHFEIFEYNGSSHPAYLRPGAAFNFTTSAQPTIPSSALLFASIDGDRMVPFWTQGNGTRRIMIARAGSPVTAVPVDGIDYNASAVFGSGDAILPDQFVVYDNTGGAGGFSLTGLQPATTYHFRIYEYNGSGVTTAYLTSTFASGSQGTLSPPVTQASAINFTNIGGSTLRINWTNGSGSSRLVVVRQGSAVNANPVSPTSYTSNPVFGSGGQIGVGNFVVSSGGSSNVTITNLVPNTAYHVAIYEYNGNIGPAYLIPGAVANTTTAPQPTVPSSGLLFTSIDGDRMVPFWTQGNGTRRIVVARASSAVTAVPANGTDYTANSIFGSGDAILPGQFVVFNGIGGAGGFSLTGLTPGITYHFAIFEYDGTGVGTVYLTSSFLSGSQATLGTPTIQASNISFSLVAGTSVTVNWTNGNGANRLVVARQGSAVNANPVNLITYNGNTVFGSGSQLGTGNFAIANTGTTNTGVTGLTSGTTYHFTIYEYNGSNGKAYLVPGTTGSVTTLGPPQVQATGVIAGGITTTTLQLNWTNGSGNRRLVLMKALTAVDANPVDNGTYTANSFFGTGTQLGTGNYVVFNGTANTVTVTGLQSNTTYHFAVFEFNSFGATSQFLLTNPARGNATTSVALPLSWLHFSVKNLRNRIELNWSTASENNTSHFEIQRNALNDPFNFIMLGTVQSAGNSSVVKQYVFTDDAPLPGMNYYRVKQYDRDNRFTYSAIVAIKYEPSGLIRSFLNPIDQTIFVSMTAFDPNLRTVNEWLLYSMNGTIVARDKITSATIYGNTPYLPAGLYILELRVNDKIERLRIIKQ